MENQIVMEHVNKFYGKKQALKDINLTIEQGMFGLLGRNGAGKTTLMKILATLHGKQSGSVTVCGIPIESAKEVREITGYLPQDFSMYPAMTVWEAMDYLGALSEIPKQERRARIDRLLKKVNLSDERHKKVRSLSGGMKRRLGIAQALVHEPRVLIVDEPTAGLDPEERIRFRNLLCEVAQERIVILSTHIVGDIEATCENLAVLNEGEILWKGTLEEILANAEGRVWRADVGSKALAQIKKDYIVTGMLKQGGHITVRFLSDTVPDVPGAAADEANCEDAYMYCLFQNGCEIMGGEEACS
ncbi:MAG: ABC transporter ATP-binding protein [Lachnospiraceae bacterium]|nr:ABC transporter ATP-binding protein [Lachnospiraceae bacterium]